jgi:hypothetical protein
MTYDPICFSLGMITGAMIMLGIIVMAWEHAKR